MFSSMTGFVKNTNSSRCWWLMPIIADSQDAEIRRMEVPGQPRQKVSKIPSLPLVEVMGCICNLS
jgi:hypothetical protein